MANPGPELKLELDGLTIALDSSSHRPCFSTSGMPSSSSPMGLSGPRQRKSQVAVEVTEELENHTLPDPLEPWRVRLGARPERMRAGRPSDGLDPRGEGVASLISEPGEGGHNTASLDEKGLMKVGVVDSAGLAAAPKKRGRRSKLGVVGRGGSGMVGGGVAGGFFTRPRSSVEAGLSPKLTKEISWSEGTGESSPPRSLMVGDASKPTKSRSDCRGGRGVMGARAVAGIGGTGGTGSASAHADDGDEGFDDGLKSELTRRVSPFFAGLDGLFVRARRRGELFGVTGSAALRHSAEEAGLSIWHCISWRP